MSQYSPPMAKPGSYAAPKTSGMAVTSLVLGIASFFCAIFTGLFAIIFGVVALVRISGSNGRLGGTGMAIGGIATGVLGCLWTFLMIALLLPAVQQVRMAARRTMAMNHVRQICLASLNYESAYRKFPSNFSQENPDAGENLSWRVHILPFIEEGALYEQFNLDEPWDSPNNIKLLPLMPAMYGHPQVELPEGHTVYHFPSSSPSNETPSFLVDGERGIGFSSLADGSSNTIMVIESDESAAVPWTKPQDWKFDPDDPHRATGRNFPGGFLIGFCDGSVTFISEDTSDEELRALLTRSAGDAAPWMN